MRDLLSIFLYRCEVAGAGHILPQIVYVVENSVLMHNLMNKRLPSIKSREKVEGCKQIPDLFFSYPKSLDHCVHGHSIL